MKLPTEEPSVYDTLCKAMLVSAEAKALCIVVVDGYAGSGGAAAVDSTDPAEVRRQLQALSITLRALADQADKDAEAVMSHGRYRSPGRAD